MNGIRVVASKSDKKQFIDFPYQHYKNVDNWVAPLKIEEKKLTDTIKNPFYKTAELELFLAEKDGEVCGRIGAILNHAYNDFHKTTIGYFGFFECIDDQKVANLLFKVAKDWLAKKGCTSVMGPFNPSNMDTLGVLVEGFEVQPSLLMPYNKAYYDTLIKEAGFTKEMDLLAYRVDEHSVNLSHIERAEIIVKKRTPNLVIRPVNLKNFDEEVKIIQRLFNAAWADNWSFYPISTEIFAKIGKDLKSILDVDLAHIAEIDGLPIAFSIALPDLNEALSKINGKLFPIGLFKLLYYSRKIKSIRTALMGVDPAYRGRGIDALLHKEAIVKGLNKGFQSAELSWVLESNTSMIRVAERIGAHVEKRYRIYTASL